MEFNKKNTGYIFLASSVLIVVLYNYRKAEVRMISAWDAIGNFIGNAFFYGIAVVVGLIGLFLLTTSDSKRKYLVVACYLASVAGSFYYLHIKTTDSGTPAYIFAQGSSKTLNLRIDSSYRITNYAYHMGESWQEGKYSLAGNKITLISKELIEGGLDRELWIRRDTLFYGDAGSDTTRVQEGHYLAIEKQFCTFKGSK